MAVGRQAEMQQFSAALNACAETGSGQAVYLRGEAGIGKTRLTEEFDRRFARPYELVREIHLEENGGLHRWSRFARPE